jgi:hypothetical protein
VSIVPAVYVIGNRERAEKSDRSRHPAFANGKLYALGMIGIEREDDP